MRSQNGQMVLMLILIMTVALGIGLSVIQRSLGDVSNSSKVEQSSRAFSAAEAGIERVLRTNTPDLTGVNQALQDSSVNVTVKPDLPADRQALEYDQPIGKEEIAQVWLANPSATPPAKSYDEDSLDIYWGTPASIDATNSSDWPAIEITLVSLVSNNYQSQKFYIDPNTTRTNGFTKLPSNTAPVVGGSCTGYTINTSSSSDTTTADRSFYCKATLSGLKANNKTLMLLRARILYSSTSHAFAVKPTGTGSLPKQAKIYISQGLSGNTQRTVRLFKLDKVVPPYFDYAIFSTGDINK